MVALDHVLRCLLIIIIIFVNQKNILLQMFKKEHIVCRAEECGFETALRRRKLGDPILSGRHFAVVIAVIT
jgi:hypothetical protein